MRFGEEFPNFLSQYAWELQNNTWDIVQHALFVSHLCHRYHSGWTWLRCAAIGLSMCNTIYYILVFASFLSKNIVLC